MVSVLSVKVRGFEVLPSLQWSNWYPLFAVAEITAVGAVHVGATNIVTVPIVVSADIAVKEACASSRKFEK